MAAFLMGRRFSSCPGRRGSINYGIIDPADLLTVREPAQRIQKPRVEYLQSGHPDRNFLV
jgi:hypothetical protein